MAAPDNAPPHRKPATNGEALAAAEPYEYPSEEPTSSHTTPPPPVTNKKGGGAAAAAAGGAGVKPKKPLDPSEVRIGDCECGGGETITEGGGEGKKLR